MRATAWLLLACTQALTGCHRADADDIVSDADPVGAMRASATQPAGVTVNLSDATVEEAARTLAAASNRPVAIDVDAQVVAQCARLTLIVPSPRPAGELASLLDRAVQPAGLRVENQREGLVVRRVPGAPIPEACAIAQAASAHLVGRGTGPSSALTPGADAGAATPQEEPRQAIIQGITQVSETEYVLTPEAANALGADSSILVRSARIIPRIEGGSVVGMRVFGVRRDSVVAHLGIRNGDTVLSLNGRPLSSPDSALEAYVSQRGRSSAVLEIDRRGQRMELRYRIAPSTPSR